MRDWNGMKFDKSTSRQTYLDATASVYVARWLPQRPTSRDCQFNTSSTFCCLAATLWQNRVLSLRSRCFSLPHTLPAARGAFLPAHRLSPSPTHWHSARPQWRHLADSSISQLLTVCHSALTTTVIGRLTSCELANPAWFDLGFQKGRFLILCAQSSETQKNLREKLEILSKYMSFFCENHDLAYFFCFQWKMHKHKKFEWGIVSIKYDWVIKHTLCVWLDKRLITGCRQIKY